MRKIYLLPNLFTSANLFCGVAAIAFAFEGNYALAAAAIIAGLIFDFCDGVVARLQRTSSRFGMEYDSLADMVTYGVAPVALIYKMHVIELGGNLRTGLGVAFLYVTCMALRLARYNVQTYHAEKGNFLGFPSPAAAGVLASLVLTLHRHAGLGKEHIVQPIHTHLLILTSLPLAFLMVSTVRYPALVQILRPRGKKPFVHLVIMLAAVGGMIFYIEAAMLSCFAIYAASGPVRVCYRTLVRKPLAARKPPLAALGELPRKRRARRSSPRADSPAQQGDA
jgi:CDP-diacylglycerol--serine O-phosphatidyltransferase